MSAMKFAVMVGALSMSFTCVAQDKAQLREQAKTLAEQLRRVGEPMDRCSLGVRLVDGAIITHVSNGAQLKLGDRLLAINHSDVSGQPADFVVGVLRSIQPGASVEIKVARQSAQESVTAICENSRPVIETILAGLDAATRGKFDECASAFGRRNDLGAFGAGMRVQCAALTKNPNQLSLANMGYDALKEAIAEAHWAPSARPGVVAGLRQAEGMISGQLGEKRFRELVDATKQWPEGEQMYDHSEPDMGLFRQAAEQAVRSRLIDPDSARIEWPFGFLSGSWKPPFQKRIDGYWTCGLVNAKNRMGGYTGRTSFVAVVSPSGIVQYVELGTGRDFDLLSSQCANSIKLLPPAPPSLTASPRSASGGSSIADDLKKLVELKESGALTEAEFQAAKQRLLTAPSQP